MQTRVYEGARMCAHMRAHVINLPKARTYWRSAHIGRKLPRIVYFNLEKTYMYTLIILYKERL